MKYYLSILILCFMASLCYSQRGQPKRPALAPAENAITNASRNFKGRFGSPEASAYVASSATVAASAIAGRIVSPAGVNVH